MQRTRELAIRHALGRPTKPHTLDGSRGGFVVTLAGVIAGIGGAVALTRVMKGLLFRVSATDPGTFAGAALLLIFLALPACYIPGRRAARMDPMVALRES